MNSSNKTPSLTNICLSQKKLEISKNYLKKYKNLSKSANSSIKIDLGKDKLLVNTIYKSIQGESKFAQGNLCTFIRLTGCSLRCSWCDSSETFFNGFEMTIDQIIAKVKLLGVKLVELTGGEPLAQKNTNILMNKLIDHNFTVMIETSSAYDISIINPKIIIIMDLKCPGSNMQDHNLYDNLNHLKQSDELKFVITNKNDYHWSKMIIKKHKPNCTILMSPAHGLLKPKDLAHWLMEDNLNVKLNLQIHKYIWHPNKKNT